MKYTAIWVDSWMMGNKQVSLTKAYRFECSEDVQVMEHLDMQGIADAVVFLFEGWPRFCGEKEEYLVGGHF